MLAHISQGTVVEQYGVMFQLVHRHDGNGFPNHHGDTHSCCYHHTDKSPSQQSVEERQCGERWWQMFGINKTTSLRFGCVVL